MGKQMLNFYELNTDTNEVSCFYSEKLVKVISETPEPKTATLTTAEGFLPVKYLSGDFGGGFVNLSLPTPSQPCIVIVADTNTTTPGTRLYVFTDSWKYVDLA